MRSEILKAAVEAAHAEQAEAIQKGKVAFRGVRMSRAQRRQVALEGAKPMEGRGSMRWAKVGSGRGAFYSAEQGGKNNRLTPKAKRFPKS
jgi:hypothetical protein